MPAGRDLHPVERDRVDPDPVAFPSLPSVDSESQQRC